MNLYRKYKYTMIRQNHRNLMKLTSSCFHMLLQCTITKKIQHSSVRVVGGRGSSHSHHPQEIFREGGSVPRKLQTGKNKSELDLGLVFQTKQKNAFGGPGGGPLDPDRDLVTIPGCFRSRAEMATRFRPKMIFRGV